MSSEFTREKAIEVLDRATSDGKSWRDCVVDAVIAAHRLGAESVPFDPSMKMRSDAWYAVFNEINLQNPQRDKSGNGQEDAVREIRRVYAECKQLRVQLTAAQVATIDESKRAAEAERLLADLTIAHHKLEEELKENSDAARDNWNYMRHIAEVAGVKHSDYRNAWRDSMLAWIAKQQAHSVFPKPAPELKLTDLTKPVQTRVGRKARIICTDFKGGHGKETMIALVTDEFGIEYTTDHWADGRYMPGTDSDEDIVNVPAKPRRVKVEVRLCGEDGDYAAFAKILDGEDIWSHAATDEIRSETTIEMELPEE